MRVLILGATGMLGHQLLKGLASDFEVAGTVRAAEPHPALRRIAPQAAIYCGVTADEPNSLRDVIGAFRPDFVINSIGLVKQIHAPALPSIRINAMLPHQLAEMTAAAGARFVHFSTDCVFSGLKGPYGETDIPDPVDLYGRTKLLGEISAPGALTLRLSIIGHELQSGRGLLEWFLSQRGRRVKGYARALYSGLTTNTVAALIARLLRDHSTLEGLWQVSAEPISKFELLRIVDRIYGSRIDIERDESFVCDRRLDSARFRRFTGWQPSSWDDMVREMFVQSEVADVG